MAKMKRADVEKQMAVNHGRVVNEKKSKELKDLMDKKMAKRPAARKIII